MLHVLSSRSRIHNVNAISSGCRFPKLQQPSHAVTSSTITDHVATLVPFKSKPLHCDAPISTQRILRRDQTVNVVFQLPRVQFATNRCQTS
ncbi:hypothetical protein AHAS_Ahas01G0011700 [Arachis hypogaea]